MTDYTQPHVAKCYQAPSANEPLVPGTITRRACGPTDVVIDIEYSGICHSDIHQARDEWASAWGPGIFPMVPGHEIVGTVVAVGADVKKFIVGDRAGVGCMVDSCRNCRNCRRGDENYCQLGNVSTYNSRFKFPHCSEYDVNTGGNPVYGGYSSSVVVDESFTLKVDKSLDVSRVAPLLCAGITTYAPMITFGLRPNHRFAVAGLGGLGHMGLKLAKAFGCHVTVISRGTDKKASAMELGADAYLDSKDPIAFAAARNSFDFILNCIACEHDVDAYMRLLDLDGKMVMVGLPADKIPITFHAFIEGRRTLSGSLIGSIQETQDMLDFCARNQILPEVEVIKADQINEAYERCMKSDVKYRFVIDAKTF